MPSLDTTNLMLGILAAAAVAQFLLIAGTMIFVARQIARLRSEVARFDLAPLQQHLDSMKADLHAISVVTERLGREVERTVQSARTIIDVVGSEVNRVSRVMDKGLGLFESGYRRAFAVGVGLRSGVRELLAPGPRGEADARDRSSSTLEVGT